ncbi:MAG: hypothetical protein WBA18_18315 [Terracidiphilus sp.]
MSGDANRICGAPNRTTQQVIEIEFPLQTIKFLFGQNSAWRTRANCHTKSCWIDVRKRRNHIFGQPNSEIVLGQPTQILNGQNPNPDAIMCFLWREVTDPLNGSNETIAKLWECFDEYRLFGVVIERDADLTNAKV